MLEILVCSDEEKSRKLFLKNKIEYNSASFAVCAVSGEDCIGYCLFRIEKRTQTVLYIEPVQDLMLADGLLRSALHVGCEREITEAFYGERISSGFLKRINFLENESEKRLKLQNLFSDCCCGKA